ncbi:hypothetical protein [Polluticoccus soli]|uniref:hypothetical protein n=1 Tax=Polluticoccus soli TaxID=3034150 RepID=UPI0023E1D2A3|nr:hypothetical protein [Flavipsychrobacter sp. JY13-12]
MLLLLCTIVLACPLPSSAQRKLDSLTLDSIKVFKKSKWLSGLWKKGLDAITRNPNDTAAWNSTLNTLSENPYKEYDGRYIRDITITRISFKQGIKDSTRKMEVLAYNVMHALHPNTREWVIRNHLFIRPGTRLDPYRTADNERFLRTLNFIQDVRIVVKPVNGSDTVDIEVITKDLFTLSGGFDIGSLQRATVEVQELNLLGMGQRVKLRTLLHGDRDPVFGYKAEYTKYSIGGSFINGYFGIFTAGQTLFDQWEEEHGYYVKLERPLVSPNTRLAGGLIYAKGESIKAYEKGRADSMFFKYDRRAYDGWFGYNLITDKLIANRIRDRKFISARYARNIFDQVPEQVTGFDPIFNNTETVLGQITFFRQNFYKTNYVFGFGITEDIPYGYNVSVTGGWQKQLWLERPYAGIKADRYYISPGKDFYRFFFRTGAFYRGYTLEDAGLLIGTNMFTRMFTAGSTRIRQFSSVSYSGIFNRYAGDVLRINNPFGLYNFNSRWITGDQRIGVLSETYFYLKYSILGFRFAPFVTVNAVTITPEQESFQKADIYTAIGGGIRVRNNALVFGTMELRGLYFPRDVAGEPSYKILLNTNLRYRYNSNFVVKPDIITLNLDDGL